MNKISFELVRDSFNKMLDNKTLQEIHDLEMTLAVLMWLDDHQRELILTDIVLAKAIRIEFEKQFQSIILGGGFDVQSGEEKIR